MVHPDHPGPLLARFHDMLEIAHSLPGRRFQERYRRKQREKGSAWKRCGFVLAGIVLTLVGVFFLAVPGPGIPILAVGLALVAQESVVTARLLDRAELRLRRWWKRLRG
jgi:Putative transmembrane protein (PGPGW)